MNLEYRKIKDYLVPNIEISPENKSVNLGKYGRARERYLKGNKPSYFEHLVMTEQIASHLAGIEHEAKVTLRNKNVEYKNLLDEVADIKINYPNLQMISEDTDDISLTKSDCKMIQKLFNLEPDIRNLEDKELFFVGGREAYFYFKNIGILKE